MKIKSKLVLLIALLSSPMMFLTGCSDSLDNYITVAYIDVEPYVIKGVNIYRENNKVDKLFPVRFYQNTPNIPYVNVREYYKEFFAHDDYLLLRDDYVYQLINNNDDYLRFDSKYNIFAFSGTDSFSNHKEAINFNGQSFLKLDYRTSNGFAEKIINLNDYKINIHSEGDNVYVPLQLLGIFSGANWLYNVAYNGKDIYVIDYQGILSSGVKRVPDYYEGYYSILKDFSSPRENDIITYNYGQICLTYDHFRGLTSQLNFGDNNLLSLGTNGLLLEYYPKIRELLLSSNKEKYYEGYNLFMGGMYDGGHTKSLISNTDVDLGQYSIDKLDQEEYAKEIAMARDGAFKVDVKKRMLSMLLVAQRRNLFPDYVDGANYYYYDNATETAYIGFDSFTYDARSWDEFYKESKDPSEAPVNTDTYAFVRSKLYQAKEDNAKNLVLDLSANGGGSTAIVHGIIGLMNGARSSISLNNVSHHNRSTEHVLVDINLDGKWDSLDYEEAINFNFNYGIITTNFSFSCGNLLPSLLKEMGYKTLGQRSGGGSCTVELNTTVEGLMFSHSSEKCLSNAKGENIDSGVPVDFELEIKENPLSPDLPDVSKFYDFNAIGDYLSNAYNK